MGRRRQVSDREISAAAREVFLDRGPKAPVAMVAKKLGVSTATLFQRTGSKQQLMLMALQPEGTVITELERGVQPGVAVREQLSQVLIELNEYLGTIIGGSVTLASCRHRGRTARAHSATTAATADAVARTSDERRTAGGQRSSHYDGSADRHARIAPHSCLHAAGAAVLAAASRIHPSDARRRAPDSLASRAALPRYARVSRPPLRSVRRFIEDSRPQRWRCVAVHSFPATTRWSP